MNISSAQMRLTLPTQMRHLVTLGEFIQAGVAQLAELDSAIDAAHLAGDLSLAAHEVCANIIDHAYEEEGEESIEVLLGFNAAQRQIELMLVDNGRSYNPQKRPWPPPHSWIRLLSYDNVKYRLDRVPVPDFEQERGRGLYLISQLVNSLIYYAKENQNYWHLVKTY